MRHVLCMIGRHNWNTWRTVRVQLVTAGVKPPHRKRTCKRCAKAETRPMLRPSPQ